ncbi:MAG: circadian clock protein KaiC [Nitrospiria bacterium]
MTASRTKPKIEPLQKAPTGIEGFDEVTGGGLPRGRPTLICGGPGCGKTLFGVEFLVKGAIEHGEPGVFVAFEETADELAKNVAALGFNFQDLIQKKLLWIDYVHIERSEIAETGEYDLEGLFVRLNHAIDSIGAKRVVLDTIEVLFSGLPNHAILRAELRRLFRWLKQKGVTAIITGERGDGNTITRQGLEEYVSDCVITLDHRITDQVSTRRLRVVKYRGSSHGTNEYPFLIDESGVTVMPVTSMGLSHAVPTDRISTGLPELDTMFGGEGYYRASSMLVSGTAGTGKSSIAAAFADGTCRRGERCLYFAFEESASQIVRNMCSIGIDLQPWIDKGLLQIHAARPALHGLETHLAIIQKRVQHAHPKTVIIDPITNFMAAGIELDIHAMLGRLLDFLKTNQVTSMFTSLTLGGAALEKSEAGISSLMDAWILLRDIEVNGERNRILHLLKARGTPHSNQVREFLLTSTGISLVAGYQGTGAVLTGSARLAQDAHARALETERQQEIAATQRRLEHERQILEAKVSALRTEYETKEDELTRALEKEHTIQVGLSSENTAMQRSRKLPDTPTASQSVHRTRPHPTKAKHT